ncbi:tetratricopeptide repeat protein, partial [Candidatus Sumerlaeota bacterium]|nr:tetratricopeptide repeat protein [Candidatus Sumerlaeota bacterium]
KLINYRAETVQVAGDTIKSFCPIHQEQVFRTLFIDQRVRRYRCSYALCPGNKGGDLIDLYARARKIEYNDAAQQIVEALKIAVELPLTDDSIRRTMEIAENYSLLGAHQEAERCYKQVLSVQPDSVAALKGMLEVHRLRNEPEQVFAILERLVNLSWDQQDYTSAMAYCQHLLEKRPDDVAARMKYAECLMVQNEIQKALEEYMRLADYFETRKELDRALEIYRHIQAIGLELIDVYPYIIQLLVASNRKDEAVAEALNRAAVHESRGEWEAAVTCYRNAVDLEPARADVQEKLLDAMIKAGLDEGRIAEALQSVEQSIRAGAYGAAMHVIEKMLQARPGHIAVMTAQADVLERQGRKEAATETRLAIIAQLIKEKRTDVAARQLLQFSSLSELNVELLERVANSQRQCGLVAQATETYRAISERLLGQGRFEQAAAICETLLEINPDDVAQRERQIEFLERAGRADLAKEKSAAWIKSLIAKRQWNEARTAMAGALALAPKDPPLLELRAQLLCACGEPEEAREVYMALGQQYVAARQWDAAQRVVQSLLADNPNNVQGALLLADIGVAQNDTRAAREHLNRIAAQLLGQKDYAGAKAILTKVRDLAPDDMLVLTQLATVYENLGEDSQLLDCYRKLATAYMANEAYGQALKYCDDILTRDAENVWALEQKIRVYEKSDRARMIPEICLRLTQIYEKQGSPDQVHENFERALRLDPSHTEARVKYVRFLARSHRYEAASNHARVTIGQLIKENRTADAKQLIEELLAQAPDDIALRREMVELSRREGKLPEYISQCTQLINAYQRRNEMNEVVELYRDLLQYEPDNVTFRTQLIDALLRLKRRNEAIEQYFELAERYAKAEDHEDAEHTLMELLNHSPGNPRALEMLIETLIRADQSERAAERAHELSETYLSLGKTDKAIEVLQRVLAFEPENADVQNWLREITRRHGIQREAATDAFARAEVRLKKGDLDAAIKAHREAVALRPDNLSVRLRLADLLEQQGDVAASREELLRVAQFHAEQQQYDKALGVLDEVLARDPEHYGCRRLRAEIMARMGGRERPSEEPAKPTAAPLPSTASPSTVAVETAKAGVISGSLPVVPDFTFETFVVGEHNRFAYATALGVAKAPAIHYNPLFLYSDVGLGKTHLINAIANHIIHERPEFRLLYTSGEEFTSQLVEAIQNNTLSALRNLYKSADVLLVDDIQFIAGQERAQEEFFLIFNALFQAKHQIIVTSDRPPKDIEHLEKRLRSRFGSGVIVDIQMPDAVTRAAILKKELERYPGLRIDTRLLSLIAERINTNIRELKGVLNHIRAKQEMSGAEIDEAFVVGILEMYSE